MALSDLPLLIIQDSWEDEEEEEKKDVEKPQVEPPKSAASKKPKKALAEKIDEKEVSFVFLYLLWKRIFNVLTSIFIK